MHRHPAGPAPRVLAAALVSSMLLWNAASATTIVVAPDGSGDHSTIQDAINAAATDDEIVLLDGTFTGPGNRDLSLGGTSLTIRSASNDASRAVIDCEFAGRAIVVGGSELLSLIEIGISNGRIQGSPARGGGILVEGNGMLEIVGCVIRNCEALGNSAGAVVGGGIATVDGSTVSATGVWFIDNRAGYGFGGPPTVFSGGGLAVTDLASATLSLARFEGNTAFQGGGLYSENGISLNSCVFEANVARFDEEGVGGARRGGGAAVLGGVSIDHTTFSDNEAVGGGSGEAARGGGLWVRGSGSVRYSTFTGNSARLGDASSGGGADVEGVTLVDCEIVANTLGTEPAPFAEGGGIRAIECRIETCSITGNHGQLGSGVYAIATDIIGCTIAGNGDPVGGSLWGGGVCSFGDVTIERTIVRGNCVEPGGLGSDLFADGTTTLSCSALDPADGAVVGTVTWVGEPVYDDPIFCEPVACEQSPTIFGDYALSSMSPCLPGMSPCGELIGLFGIGCEATPVETTSWGRLKSRF